MNDTYNVRVSKGIEIKTQYGQVAIIIIIIGWL